MKFPVLCMAALACLPLMLAACGGDTCDDDSDTADVLVLAAAAPAPALALAGASTPGPDTVAPVVTSAAVEGNFGLVKLTALAADDQRLSTVQFFVDGAPTGQRASGRLVSTDRADLYFTLFDTTGLSNGTHRVFARATDAADNQSDSVEVAFTVDNGAGFVETGTDDSMAMADVLPLGEAQVAGALDGAVATPSAAPDADWYAVSIPAFRTLRVDLLALRPGDCVVQLVDADGSVLSAPQETTASAVDSIRYANGQGVREAWLRVASIDAGSSPRNPYRLSLSYQWPVALGD